MTPDRKPGTGKLLGRALLLRCPNCGAGDLFQSWGNLRKRCLNCGLWLERGEGDYYLGAYTVALMFIETLFAVGFGVVVVSTWPDVPWAGMEYALVVMMIAAPIALYPVSRVLWLAFDILLRPPDAAEMAWHASAKDDQAE